MPKHILAVVVAAWITSLAAVAVATAQVAPQPVPPKVLSGADIGFEVTGIDHQNGEVIGRLMVKVNEKWVPAQIGGGMLRR
jgi:hypothetical protein